MSLRNEQGADDDFDYDAEDEALCARAVQESKDLLDRLLQQSQAGGGGDGISALLGGGTGDGGGESNSYERACRALAEKARRRQYHYADRGTFDAALELYNRQRSVPAVGTGNERVADVFFDRRPVRGRRKKPRSECGCDFEFGMDCVQETSSGSWGAKKVCVGCMGRRLRKAVGTDGAAIAAALNSLRESQRGGGIMTGHLAQSVFRAPTNHHQQPRPTPRQEFR